MPCLPTICLGVSYIHLHYVPEDVVSEILLDVVQEVVDRSMWDDPNVLHRLSRMCQMILNMDDDKVPKVLAACVHDLNRIPEVNEASLEHFLSLVFIIDLLATAQPEILRAMDVAHFAELSAGWVSLKWTTEDQESVVQAWARIVTEHVGATGDPKLWATNAVAMVKKLFEDLTYGHQAEYCLKALLQESVDCGTQQALYEEVIDEQLAHRWVDLIPENPSEDRCMLLALVISLSAAPNKLLGPASLAHAIGTLDDGLYEGSRAASSIVRKLVEHSDRVFCALDRIPEEKAADFVMSMGVSTDDDVKGMTKQLASRCPQLLAKAQNRAKNRILDPSDHVEPEELFPALAAIFAKGDSWIKAFPDPLWFRSTREQLLEACALRLPMRDPIRWFYLPQRENSDTSTALDLSKWSSYRRVGAFMRLLAQRAELVPPEMLSTLHSELLMFLDVERLLQKKESGRISAAASVSVPMRVTTTVALDLIYAEDRQFWQSVLLIEREPARLKHQWEEDILAVQKDTQENLMRRVLDVVAAVGRGAISAEGELQTDFG